MCRRCGDRQLVVDFDRERLAQMLAGLGTPARLAAATQHKSFHVHRKEKR